MEFRELLKKRRTIRLFKHFVFKKVRNSVGDFNCFTVFIGKTVVY